MRAIALARSSEVLVALAALSATHTRFDALARQVEALHDDAAREQRHGARRHVREGKATIHAGEAFGLPSIWEAVQFCGSRVAWDMKG